MPKLNNVIYIFWKLFSKKIYCITCPTTQNLCESTNGLWLDTYCCGGDAIQQFSTDGNSSDIWIEFYYWNDEWQEWYYLNSDGFYDYDTLTMVILPLCIDCDISVKSVPLN